MQYQSALRGNVNPSIELLEVAARDASELAGRFQPPSKSERLCLVGSAKHSTRELLAALEHIMADLPQNTWFLGGGPDVLSGELVVRSKTSTPACCRCS